MKLKQLIDLSLNKGKFNRIVDYKDFALRYLEFIKNNLQAVIVSKNEQHYRFFQYNKDGNYNVTRPINSNLMYSFEEYEKIIENFFEVIKNINDTKIDSKNNRTIINRFVYTTQQCIGASLDGLGSNKSNFARKINGDLFERFIRLIISSIGVDVRSGTIQVPIRIDGEVAFNMSYQHDLIIEVDNEERAIGSVKTSSKDRIDKIFIDKFLLNRLTDVDTPHFAIFLNDVQRKGKENSYGINSTFLTGHFKGYTIKLNPLDGVYYFDLRPNMLTDDILKDQIKPFDKFIFEDVWKFIE